MSSLLIVPVCVYTGIWGTLISVLIVYPIANSIPGSDTGGVYENFADSVSMIQNSVLLQNLLIGFVVTVTIYNCLVVYVTKYLSSIWHAILDNFRPLTIWMLSLFVHYSVSPNFGEVWTSPGSYIQLVGLMFLFLGTAVYDGKVAVCDSVVEYQSLIHAPTDPDVDNTISMTKSPLIYRKNSELKDLDEPTSNNKKKTYYSEI